MSKTIDSAKRNISLIFLFACQTFKIHLENLTTGKSTTIDDTTTDIIKLSDTLITFSDVDSPYNEYLKGFVDLLEETQLPDIASSNRQGYKEDDERFVRTLDLIKRSALRPVLELKADASKEKNYIRDLEKVNKAKASKEAFDKSIKEVIENPDFKKVIQDSAPIKTALERAWELKDTLKETYKKILISHNSGDKELIDELERVLHFCGFEKEEIIYTSSDHYESGFGGAYVDIYDYLKDFFVNTTRRTDLCVIYILNQDFVLKRDPVLEAGAGWVLNTTWYPMYTDRFESVRKPFPGTEYTPKLTFGMNDKQIHVLANAIYQISQHAQKFDQSEESIFQFIKATRLSGTWNESTIANV